MNDVFNGARLNGQRESLDAYTADGVVNAFRAAAGTCRTTGETAEPDQGETNPGPSPATNPVAASGSRRPDTKIIAYVDWEALRRGRREGDEVCGIAGVGPVPASTVRGLLGEANLALVVRNGVDIAHVTHLGRAATAHQRTALEARGYRCAVPGCGSDHRLEIDHVTGWVVTETTRLDDLEWLCHHHHRQKTHAGFLLKGPPGRRTWHHPDGTVDHPISETHARAGPVSSAGSHELDRPSLPGHRFAPPHAGPLGDAAFWCGDRVDRAG